MRIQILGTGCAKCRKLAETAEAAARELGLECEFEKVTKINEIVKFGVMMTPGLVINDQLKSVGKVPADDELLKWIQES